MLKLDLNPILKVRLISQPYTFLKKKGFTHNITIKLLSGDTRACQLKHIEQLCDAFLCLPNDLLVWHPDKNELYADNYPLKKLEPSPEEFNLNKAISEMPLDEMREFAKRAHQMLKGEEEM